MPYADPDVARVKAAERNRRYRERHPTASRDAQRRRRERRPDECKDIGRDRRLKELYGLSLAEYRAIEAAQNNRCAICGGPPATGQSLAVDHCHETDENRELLCNSCNCGLGMFREEPWRFRAAINYLAKHKRRLTKVRTTETEVGGET